MQIDPSVLVGPFALTFALAATVVALWRDHQRADQDDRDMRDRAMSIAEKLVTDAEGRQRAADRER